MSKHKTFTMEQFIAEHKLGVDLGNPQATRMIVKKLRKAGYRQIRVYVEGKRQAVWTNEPDTLGPLKDKLEALDI